MNLFVLSAVAEEAARDHNDRHCIKMILETAQLLYTAWHCARRHQSIKWRPGDFFSDTAAFKPYRMTHRNHPVARWVRARPEHYRWAVRLGLALCAEYTRRYGRRHKTETHLRMLEAMGPPPTPPTPSDEATAKADGARKRATAGCPEGCAYFDCAVADDVFDACAAYTPGGDLDCVATYRNYYARKRMQHRWNRGTERAPGWFSPPHDLS
jgi:hypothetical protein